LKYLKSQIPDFSEDMNLEQVRISMRQDALTPRCILGLSTTMAMLLCAQNSFGAATKVTTVSVPSGGKAIVAKTDGRGTIHLVFDSDDGPQYASSTDNGKTFGKSMPLVDQGSRKPGLEFITWDMAVTSEGAVHIVLGNNAWKLKLPQEEWGFFYTRLLPQETSFPPLRNVNHKPSEGFSLAATDTGMVTAVWMSDKLFANVSKDGGETFGETIEIDPALNPCNCCTTSCAYGADGRLAILYREETDNERDMYLALWNQESDKVTKSRVSTTPWIIDSCPMTYYTIARSGNGFAAAWPTKGQIYFARFDANGILKSPKEIKTPGSNGHRTGVLTLPTNDGGAVIAWKKDGQLGWQLYDERGRPSGTPGSARSAGNGAAGTLAKNGDVILFR
jgi:hypothetical protein